MEAPKNTLDESAFRIAWRKKEDDPVTCPLCGMKHWHSLGDGHRAAHCIKNVWGREGGYWVKTGKPSA